MKRFYTILGLVALAVVSSCSNKEETAVEEQQYPSFYGIMEAPVDVTGTRAYVNESFYGFWNKGDYLSIFYANTYNKKFTYVGSSGTTSGRFDPVEGSDGLNGGVAVENQLNYAIYPYDDYNACQEADGTLIVPFPKERTISTIPDGLGASIMFVAKSETTQLPFRHVAGYLGFQFYGEGVSVASISLKSNSNEPLSGSANVVYGEGDKLQVTFVDRDHEDDPTCTFNYNPAISLDASAEGAKVFWITLPPTTFESGVTLTVKDANGGVWERVSSLKEVKINTFQRFNPMEVKPVAPAVPVTGVTVSPTSLEMTEGEESILTATVAPANATNKNVTWTSNDSDVATVDADGKVSAVAAGTATITVTTEDGGETATCAVTVKEKVFSVESVSLDEKTLELFVGDAPVALTATIAPSNATNKNVTWASSDESVATVDKNGKVSAVAAGTATITVTTEDGSKTDECVVTVKIHVESVTLDKETLTMSVGDNPVALEATVSPDNATNKSVTWESNNTAVATVDANGKVSAVAAGSATITVTTVDGGETATCAVTVKNVVTYAVVIDPAEDAEVNAGSEFTFKLMLTTTTNGVAGEPVNVAADASWTSSDTAIATIAAGVATGIKEGNVTITAKYTLDGAEKTLTAPLKVNKNPNQAGDDIPIGGGGSF